MEDFAFNSPTFLQIGEAMSNDTLQAFSFQPFEENEIKTCGELLELSIEPLIVPMKGEESSPVVEKEIKDQKKKGLVRVPEEKRILREKKEKMRNEVQYLKSKLMELREKNYAYTTILNEQFSQINFCLQIFCQSTPQFTPTQHPHQTQCFK